MLEIRFLDILNKREWNIKKVVFIVLIFITQNLWAMPKNLVVWFVSPNRSAFLDSLENTKKFQSIAQAPLQCQPMGEYCFDPQIGLYNPNEKDGIPSTVEMKVIEDNSKYQFLDSAKSVEREMIKCEKDAGLFDIFCGKAKLNKTGRAGSEIWFDVSTTMRQVDPEFKKGSCYREELAKDLDKSCALGKDLDIYTFTEDRKQIDIFNRVCGHYGLNNMNHMMVEIQNLDLDTLIIVTDIFEAEEKFISFIERNKGKILGLKEPLYAKDMKTHIKKITKYCD
jgi:hypothetical protein